MMTLKQRWSCRQPLLDDRTGVVLFIFSLLALQSPVVGVTRIRLSSHKYSSTLAIVAGFVILVAVLLALLIALIRGHRWAWLVFVVLYGPGLIFDVFNFTGFVEFGLDVIRFAFLMSSPMRRHVGGVKCTRQSGKQLLSAILKE
jgi:hypothetical protein